ncbi:MAG: anthrone oxygenase family protein [Cyanobacteria bacterium P01_H01_bin.152]
MAIFDTLRLPLVLFAAIGSALSAGIFFAFSTFVIQALGRQTASSGIAAMQSINITVINPWFMAVFLGPAAVGLVLAIAALRQWEQPGAAYWLAGALLYVIGTVGVTIAGNVPLNDALAVVNPDSPEGTLLWTRYLTDWTFWNHVRTAAALLAATLFTVSLLSRSESLL